MVGFFRKKNKAIEKLAKEVHALGGMVDLLSNRVESLENSSSKKKEDEAYNQISDNHYLRCNGTMLV